MRKFLFVMLFLLTGFTACSQNLIGKSAREIKNYMSVNNRDMNLEKVSNKSFSYLKYSDSNDNQTMLFFLSPDSLCTNIRIVCNNNIRGAKIRELDTAYVRTDENVWIDNSNGKSYLLKLVDDDWSFSIIIEADK